MAPSDLAGESPASKEVATHALASIAEKPSDGFLRSVCSESCRPECLEWREVN